MVCVKIEHEESTQMLNHKIKNKMSKREMSKEEMSKEEMSKQENNKSLKSRNRKLRTWWLNGIKLLCRKYDPLAFPRHCAKSTSTSSSSSWDSWTESLMFDASHSLWGARAASNDSKAFSSIFVVCRLLFDYCDNSSSIRGHKNLIRADIVTFGMWGLREAKSKIPTSYGQ